MFKTTLLAATALLAVSTQAQARNLEFCTALSESVGSLAELRDSGMPAGQSFRAMLEAGLDAEMAAELLNLVYIDAKDLSPEEIETASFAICVQEYN